MTARVLHGDVAEVCATLEADSFDAILCDPPYALTANKRGGTGAASLNLNSPAGRSRIGTEGGGFMGCAWDSAIPGPDVWAAERLGRKWIGCELSMEYTALAKDRTAQRGLPFRDHPGGKP